jgi:hypothetical protein
MPSVSLWDYSQLHGKSDTATAVRDVITDLGKEDNLARVLY